MLLVKFNKKGFLSSLILVLVVCFFTCLSFAQDSRDSENTKPKHFLRGKIETKAAVRDCGPFNASSNIRQTPDCTDTRFWVDVDTGLDTGCTFRSGSPLTFNVKIDRYVGDFAKLKASGSIGNMVTIRIPAFDVDYNGSGTGGNPERDQLSINGHIIGDLQGGNNIWHLNEFQIPVDWLNFPDLPGRVANNNFRIDIDRLNGGWCVGADWAAADIDVARPALFVHGIFSTPGTWSSRWITTVPGTPERLEITNLGLPADTINVGFLPDTIGSNAQKISNRMQQLKNQWKVDKINLIGHSKGGLDSRDYAETSDSVSQVIQIGTPNAGSPLADYIIIGGIIGQGLTQFPINEIVLSTAPGGYQLTRPYMSGYNFFHRANPDIQYTALAGLFTPDCTSCLLDYWTDVIGEGDLIVPVESVYSLNFTRNLDPFRTTGPGDCPILDILPSSLSVGCDSVHVRQTGSIGVFNKLSTTVKQFDPPLRNVKRISNSIANNNPQLLPSLILTASQFGLISQGENQTRTLIVDQTSNVIFPLLYRSGNLDMALISPSGQRFDHTTIPGNPNVTLADVEIPGGRTESIAFTTLERGTWTIEIQAPSVVEPGGQAAYAVAGVMQQSSPINLTGSFTNSNVRTGSPLQILANLKNSTDAITNATVTAIVQLPDNTKQNITLQDDGVNGDVTPNDGIYTGNFINTTQVGSYNVVVVGSRSINGVVPAFSRQTLLRATVSQTGSTLTGNYSDFGLDTNSNTLFNKLVVQTGVNITNNGNYRILGTITDSAGNTLSTVKRATLNSGSQNVQLEFDGEQIYQNRVNGAFTLTNLKLLEETGTELSLLDERSNAYQTSSYQFLAFEHLPIVYSGVGSAVGIDTNANNRFDILRVTLGIDVTVTGVYNWTAQIIDRNGTDLGFTTGSGSLTAGANNIIFNFNGTTIGQNNVDGPYTITGLLVFRQNFSLIEGNVLTTPPFLASQFEGSTVVTPAARLFDFDGDRKTDFSVFRPNLGQWWYLRSSDGANRVFQFGSDTDKIAPADFTGDGKTDIAFFRPSLGSWYVLRSDDASFYAVPFGTIGDIPIPADYDGDGKSDIAVFRPSTGTWYISKSLGGTIIQQFGASGDAPVVADYDGDGKADLAIWRQSVGEWWYFRSSDGTHRAVQFGANTDKPLPGDYTGDGKADIAFYRTSSPGLGNWFILRSEDASFYSFPYGTNGDIPASGDYDGDGKFDAAVFRPSTTTWYVNRSTSGSSIQVFGATGDLPVPSAFVP
jgi:hypothetical protein